MSIKLKVAWILSILATALASLGLVGNATSATFSDTVTVTHEIQTGHVKIRIVSVDGQAVDPPVRDYRLTDVVKGARADITRVVELRNEGSLEASSLFLTATPGAGDSPTLAKQLSVTVGIQDDTGATQAVRTLAEWEAAPRELDLPSKLAPGESVTVTMHTTGTLDMGEKAQGVEPTYAFTVYDNS